jgi:hypothetical protein
MAKRSAWETRCWCGPLILTRRRAKLVVNRLGTKVAYCTLGKFTNRYVQSHVESSYLAMCPAAYFANNKILRDSAQEPKAWHALVLLVLTLRVSLTTLIDAIDMASASVVHAYTMSVLPHGCGSSRAKTSTTMMHAWGKVAHAWSCGLQNCGVCRYPKRVQNETGRRNSTTMLLSVSARHRKRYHLAITCEPLAKQLLGYMIGNKKNDLGDPGAGS